MIRLRGRSWRTAMLILRIMSGSFWASPSGGYTAPHIIRTFLESYDFTGKTIVLFATSGSSGIGKTGKELASSCPGAKIIEGRMLNGNPSEAELKKWVESL